VTSHRCDDERLGAEVAEHIDRRPDHRLQIRDPAAADADTDGHARPNPLRKDGGMPKAADLAGHVGDDRLRMRLAQSDEWRDVHGSFSVEGLSHLIENTGEPGA
jgi:hypothetical protein